MSRTSRLAGVFQRSTFLPRTLGVLFASPSSPNPLKEEARRPAAVEG